MGPAGVALSPLGIRHATLFHRTREAALAELRAFGAEPADDPRAPEITRLLQEYAAGQPVSLDHYPVDLPPGGGFQRRVWLALREIPRGETRSYGWMARRLDQPGAARAVGAAAGANPIPLWLPCHRLVAGDGSLHGFGGGLAMKQALLELEGALPRRLV
ncbi:methylated-DNA--[protein]-cysteine S-methyltransferase [bacterium]|nr:MAG: methylated-DNA--[protein]-cysteine S-methyltransferase [bacterium]MCL4231380.1 methylated-DNA--[protein]-cysteine S-methyltransferase [Dehalococcoidia bacterium]RIL03868.1 MAG: cysteine methyltransferase [bacterium]